MNCVANLASLWAPFLAVDVNSPAYRVGYMLGGALGLLLVLALVAFCIVAVILAFIKRTTGWIVAGSVSAVLMLFVLGVFAYFFTMGFLKGLAKGKSTFTPGAFESKETIVGKKIHFTIDAPSGWTAKRDSGAYDVVLSDGRGYLGVIAENIHPGSNGPVVDFSRNRFKTMSTDLTLGPTEETTLDGHSWTKFAVKCKVQGLPFAYENYCYAGDEGAVQIMLWTFQADWESEKPTLDRILQTLHLPTAPAAPPKASP